MCRPNQECTNTLGSYFCRNLLSCGVGFEMNSEGTRCEGDLFGNLQCDSDSISNEQRLNRAGSSH